MSAPLPKITYELGGSLFTLGTPTAHQVVRANSDATAYELVSVYSQSEADGLIGAKLSADSVSAFGLTLINDADAATARTTLGLGNVANVDTTNASNITSGTLADGRLSSNVPLKNAVNIFSQLQSSTVGLVLGGTTPYGATTLTVRPLTTDTSHGIALKMPLTGGPSNLVSLVRGDDVTTLRIQPDGLLFHASGGARNDVLIAYPHQEAI